MGEDYTLSDNNYYKVEHTKKRIVLGNSFNHDMKHVIGWKLRNNGKYKKTAPYTIDINGVVHNHFDCKYHSDYFRDNELNNESIIIIIENDGQLTKNDKENGFYTWIGDIYKEPSEVVEVKWKEGKYWSPYNEKQHSAAINLIKELCGRFNIEKSSIGHNTLIKDLNGFGVLFKSNIDSEFTDISPAWDFKKFKEEINRL